MSKRYWIAVLAGVNLLLLTALVLVSTSPKQAHAAQDTGLAGNYLVVTSQVLSNVDAVYIFDRQEHFLHIFEWDRGARRLVHIGSRNIEADFRGQGGRR